MKVAVMLLLMLAVAYVSHGAITCNQVSEALNSCTDYVTGKQAAPAEACCSGIKTLKSQATTTADRRQACQCAKQVAANMKDIKDAAVRDLPDKCNIALGYKISVNFDCSQVS